MVVDFGRRNYNQRVIGKAKKAVALLVSAVLLGLSPGFEAHRAFAQVVEGVPVVKLPSVGAPVAPAANAPTLGVSASGLSSFGAAPLLPAASIQSAPAASALAPAAAAHAALPASAVAAPSAFAAAPALTAAPAAAAAEGPKASDATGAASAATPAHAQPAGPAPIDSSVRYQAHAMLLRMVSALTGQVGSLRPAGQNLSDDAVAAAADKQAVFSDFDETLANSNAAFDNKLAPEMVSAVQAVKAAGKTVDVISDRPESVFESLTTLPAADRAGMYVAVDAGGRVYRYDATGNPVLVHEEPAMSEATKSVIGEAGAAAKARLAEVGAEPMVESGKDTAEVFRPYTYTLKLKVGSSWEQVRGAGEILQQELTKRGSPLSVRARMAKDPANAPYLVVSVNTKANASRFIARERGLTGKDVVILGDGMYAPKAANKPGWLARLGEKISGRATPDQGNGNDAEMEKGVPGARTFSVGGTGDPRRLGMLVLSKSGPEASRDVLLSVASKTAVPAPASPLATKRSVFHEIGLWFHSLRHYFLDVNVENWGEYKKARAQAPAVAAGTASVKDARGFFVDSRMMGMLGGVRIVGSVSGSDDYVTKRALAVFDRYFKNPAAAAREAFVDFLGRAVQFNPLRSSSNLRKHVRKALHAASMLEMGETKAYFDKLMQPSLDAAAKEFQNTDQERVLAALREAVVASVNEEDASASDRVVGVVLLGSFALGSATPTSDFDMHVLTANGGSARVHPFLERLEKRWTATPDGQNHPLNGADFGFRPSQGMLYAIHRDRFMVLSPDRGLERTLSPPADYTASPRANGPTLSERAEWVFYNRFLRAATMVDDLKRSSAGVPVESLSEKVRTRAVVGWLVSRSLYLAGFILAGSIAYPILAQTLVGKQGYTDLMSLGAVAAILLAPLSGVIADRLSFRNTFTLNNVVRIAVVLGVPTLILLHAATFWPLLAVSIFSSWNVASTLVTEGKLMPMLAGSDPKRLSVLNAAANMNFIGLNVLMGTFLLSGRWVDKLATTFGMMHGLSMVFLVSAGLAGAAAVIQWLTIPNVAVKKNAAAAPAADPAQSRRNAAKWAGALAVGGALFAWLHPIFPQFAALPLVGAALAGLLMTSDALRRLWKNSTLRTGSLLAMAYAFVVYPVGFILIPFAARDLNGGAALQGQLQGSLFFGQLLAGSTMLKLPGRWNSIIRYTVLGAMGAWLGAYLFPSSLALAAVGMAVAAVLYGISARLTDRGWLRYSFIGLSALALPLAFWGNIPALLLGILIVGLVNAPNKITIDTVVQREAKLDSAHTGPLLGVSSALASIAAAFGYASFGAITSAFHPAFPTALWPMLGMFGGIGALLFMASRWLGPKIAPTDFTPKAPREYSAEQLAQAVAKRVQNGGVRAIITDYDGTLMDKTPDDKAVVASDELVEIIGNLRRHGVTVLVDTNHFFTGDHNGMTNLLGERLSPADRAGMYFIVQSGARIYQYGPNGETPTEPVWKEESFSDAERARITPIFEAAAAKVGLKPEDYKIFYEDSRTLIELTNHHDRDEALYQALAEANKAEGLGYLVQLKPMPTMRHVPYVQYFKAHKGTGAGQAMRILKERGLIDDEKQALLLGDDFKPEGNDLYMAQALPGALAVSVGKTADAKTPNVMQSAVRGAAETRRLLKRLNEILDAQKAVAGQ
jgi:hydroxymethylpyrimidine pyrophosphatase-like HAD family hydrolase/predicted nucleotidyltransferase